MGKNKLAKFAKNKTFSHVLQPSNEAVLNGDFHLKGKWSEEFGNNNPIVLELACGKGEYSVGMAEIYPDKNFIGIDIKGARIFSGAKEVEDKGLKNVRFLRTKIDFINSFFAENEISEIWILFADPQLVKPRKRLTSQLFLNRYIKLLKPSGVLNLKSDSDELYAFTKNESVPAFNVENKKLQFKKLDDTNELYEKGIKSFDETMQAVLNIRTFYEQMWLEQGKKIKFLSYRLQAR